MGLQLHEGFPDSLRLPPLRPGHLSHRGLDHSRPSSEPPEARLGVSLLLVCPHLSEGGEGVRGEDCLLYTSDAADE